LVSESLTTAIYPLSLHDALPICASALLRHARRDPRYRPLVDGIGGLAASARHVAGRGARRGRRAAHSSASRSFSRSAASAATDSSAPSPSARRVTSSPLPAPRVISISMLEACTALPPGFSMVTVAGCSAAAWAKIPAGRACSPEALAIVTVRSAMVLYLSWAHVL